MTKIVEDENKSHNNESDYTITRQQLLELLELGRKPIEYEPPKLADKKKPPSIQPCDNTGINGTHWKYDYLTEEEVAKKLKCCPKTLRKLRKEKKITYHKMGKFIRYSPDDLKKYHQNTYIPEEDDDAGK